MWPLAPPTEATSMCFLHQMQNTCFSPSIEGLAHGLKDLLYSLSHHGGNFNGDLGDLGDLSKSILLED